MKSMMVLVLLILSNYASGWEVSQVKINHIQTVDNGKFYISVSGNIPDAAGCAQSWGKKNWLGFQIEPGNESQKSIMSMALAAQISGTLVDVGSGKTGCISDAPVAHLGFIRVGNYR